MSKNKALKTPAAVKLLIAKDPNLCGLDLVIAIKDLCGKDCSINYATALKSRIKKELAEEKEANTPAPMGPMRTKKPTVIVEYTPTTLSYQHDILFNNLYFTGTPAFTDQESMDSIHKLFK